MNLFDLTEEYRAFVAKLQDLDMPSEAVLDTIDGMQGEMRDKIRAVIFVALEKQKLAEARKEVAKKMAASAESEADRANALLTYAQIAIQNSGIVLPIKYPEFNVNLQKNPPSCEISNLQKVDDAYKTTTVTFKVAGDAMGLVKRFSAEAQLLALHIEPPTVDVKADKKNILAALKVGDKIDGARMNPDSYRMTIK